jgi:hypothetical protein
MNSACGGYAGWPGKSTEGSDAKLAGTEVSVSGGTGAFALENGLWTFYVNYDNTKGPGMKECSTYRDATAPFGVFTSDGNGQQFFNDHVGVKVTGAYDTSGNGVINFFEDYAIVDAFCPVFAGFNADPDKSDGFAGYCDKGLWEVIVSTNFTSESKQTAPGSKFSNSHGGGSDFSPISLAPVLAGGVARPDGGIGLTVAGVSANGQDYTLASPVSANVYGVGGLAIDISQPGMKEAAGWLANQFASMPQGNTAVTLNFSSGASLTVHVAGGPLAAIPLRTYAGS